MANGTSFGEIFGGRLSEAGSQLVPLFQLIQNTQRQNEQDVFNRAVRVEQFESEAERLRQGRETISQRGVGLELERDRVGIAREREAREFAESQTRILGSLGPQPLDFSGLPRTLEGLGVGLQLQGVPEADIGAQIGSLQGFLDPTPTGPTPPQQVARDIFGDVGTATQREATRQAQFRREGLEVPVLDPTTGQPLPLLGSQGQPQFEFNELGQQVPRLQMQPAPAPAPLLDSASVIRSGLLGGVEGFDPNDPLQRQAALDALVQIDPRFGGFLEREGLAAAAEPAAEPVGIQGRTLFDLRDQPTQEPDVFDTAQELFTAAEWQELSLRDQTDMAKAILQRENPNFDALPADLQQDSLNQKIADIESSLGII